LAQEEQEVEGIRKKGEHIIQENAGEAAWILTPTRRIYHHRNRSQIPQPWLYQSLRVSRQSQQARTSERNSQNQVTEMRYVLCPQTSKRWQMRAA